MRKILAGFLTAMVVSGTGWAAERPELTNEMDRINYSIGYQIGGDFQRQGWKLNVDLMAEGIRDAINQTTPRLTHEQMQETLVAMKKQLLADQQKAAKEADQNFLAENARREGVVVLPDGVQYKVIREGTGRQPTRGDSVTIQYRFGRIEGQRVAIDRPMSKPGTYPLVKALPGLQEAMLRMKEGALWQIVLPPGPALGNQGEALEKAGVLVYELELLAVQTGTDKPASP